MLYKCLLHYKLYNIKQLKYFPCLSLSDRKKKTIDINN